MCREIIENSLWKKGDENLYVDWVPMFAHTPGNHMIGCHCMVVVGSPGWLMCVCVLYSITHCQLLMLSPSPLYTHTRSHTETVFCYTYRGRGDCNWPKFGKGIWRGSPPPTPPPGVASPPPPRVKPPPPLQPPSASSTVPHTVHMYIYINIYIYKVYTERERDSERKRHEAR